MAGLKNLHEYDFQAGEILLINKPLGWSSFDVVNKIRYRIKVKTGHAGTLDPLATGLILICTGKATKKFESLQGLDKAYSGTMTLGATTPSYDAETPLTIQQEKVNYTRLELESATKSFLGDIEQIPPNYSAIKISGKPAYKLARKGAKLKLAGRQVHLSVFDIGHISLPEVEFKVHCSKGTYIRSLVHDYGQLLGCGAYLSKLCRTKIGDYSLDDAMELDDFINLVDKNLNHEQDK